MYKSIISLLFIMLAVIAGLCIVIFYKNDGANTLFLDAPEAMIIEHNEDTIHLSPTSLSLFKNGFSLINLKTQIPHGVQFTIDCLPLPALGTFWLGADSAIIEQVVSSKQMRKYPTQVIDFVSIALSNVGAKVTVFTSHGRYIGKISNIKVEPTFTNNTLIETAPNVPQCAPSLLVLSTLKTIECIDFATIRSLEFREKEINFPSIENEVPVLTVDLQEPAKGDTLNVSCLTQGISWVPMYRIDISDSEQLALESTAIIINELMDLENVSIELITGFPHLKFASIQSPITMRQSLLEFFNSLSSLDASRPYTRTNSILMNQASDVYSENIETQKNALAFNPTNGIIAEDLFFYPLPSISLKKGERMTKALFKSKFPYQHVYTWSPKEGIQEIWHCIRFKNTGNIPLTTAPATFYKSGRIMGQDQCLFLAPNQEATLKMNRSMSFVTEQTETETKRENITGSHLQKITGKGILSIRNTTSSPYTIEIDRKVSGTIIQASDSGIVISKMRPEYGGYNKESTIKWNFEINPYETIKKEYEYEYFR